MRKLFVFSFFISLYIIKAQYLEEEVPDTLTQDEFRHESGIKDVNRKKRGTDPTAEASIIKMLQELREANTALKKYIAEKEKNSKKNEAAPKETAPPNSTQPPNVTSTDSPANATGS